MKARNRIETGRLDYRVAVSAAIEREGARFVKASPAMFRAPFDSWSCHELLHYFQTNTKGRYFPCVDPLQTAREQIDNVLGNRFELINETYGLSAPIDWLTNPSNDLEWQILLHKFYFAAGLGNTYSQTGDSRYVRKWVELSTSWMDQVQANLLAGTSPLNSDLFVAVTGRRIQNWIYAYYYFVSAGKATEVTGDFHLRFIDSIRRQTNHLIETLAPARNHRTIELTAIFLAGVVFAELRDAEAWLEFASRELFKNVRADLLSDGVHCELSTDYHHLVLKNYLNVRRLAHLNGISVPQEIDDRLRQALNFAMHIHKPDGRIPSLSDGDIGSYLDLLRVGYELYGDSELLYVSSRGTAGTPPAQLSAGFRDSGYFVLRSGWGERGERFEDERYLVFDCGPLGEGNHGHLDLLSIEVAAFGESLVVDPGRYTYSESGDVNWRVIFRGTAYHNTVLIDGKNQTRYEPGRKRKYKIKGPAPDHELRSFVCEQGFDYLHGIARSHEYEATHERRIFFIGSEYWIVWDILESEEEHDYDQLFHLSHRAQNKVTANARQGTIQVCAPHLVLAKSEAPEVSLEIEQGYVSHIYGEKKPAPVVRFSQRGQAAAFHTVLFPYRETAPGLIVRDLPVYESDGTPSPAGTHAISVTIEREGTRFTDLCMIAERGGRWRTFAGYRFDGTYMALRLAADGKPVRLHANRGASVESCYTGPVAI
jgi:heparinase II/III-like protein